MTMMMITSTTRSLDSGFVEFTLSTFSAWVLTSLNLLVVLFQALNLNCQPQHPIQCSQEWCHHTWKMGAMNHIDIFVIITIILANNLFTITIIHYLVLLYGLLEHWDNESPVHHVLPCVNVSHCDVVVVLMITMVILVMKTMVMIRMNIYCMSFWTSFRDSPAREIEHLAVTLLTNANVMQGAMQIWWSEDDKTWCPPEPGFWSYFS